MNAKGKKLYGGYFKFYVGKDADGNVLVDKWVNRITISNAGGTEPEPVSAASLTVKGEGLTKELSFESVKALKNDEAIKPLILEGVKFHTVNSYGTEEDFTVAGVTIESLIGLAGIKGGYELESVTAVSDNEKTGKTYSADEILKEDLQGNKAMLIWDENGDKVLKTAVGQFAAGEQNRGKWWKAKDSITLTVTVKALPVLTVSGDGLVKELSYDSIKTLKNDDAIKPLTLNNVKFKTKNKAGVEAESTVTGVRIEDLIKLAGIKNGYLIESVTATASDGYAVTYPADEIFKADLQGNKAMFVWEYDKEKVQMTAVGQFAEGEANKAKWAAGDTFTLSINAKKVTKPGKPKVTLAAGKKKVTVKWKRVTGAEGYVIYRSTKKTKGFKKIKTITSGKTLKYVNKKLKGGKRYYYKVKAYKKDFNGNKVLSYYSAVKYTKTKR